MAEPLQSNRTFVIDSAPSSGADGTGADSAHVGDMCLDVKSRILYVCTAKVAGSGTGLPHDPSIPADITWQQLAA